MRQWRGGQIVEVDQVLVARQTLVLLPLALEFNSDFERAMNYGTRTVVARQCRWNVEGGDRRISGRGKNHAYGLSER